MMFAAKAVLLLSTLASFASGAKKNSAPALKGRPTSRILGKGSKKGGSKKKGCFKVYELSVDEPDTYGGIEYAGSPIDGTGPEEETFAFDSPFYFEQNDAENGDDPDGRLTGSFNNANSAGLWNFLFFEDEGVITVSYSFEENHQYGVVLGGTGYFAKVTGSAESDEVNDTPFVIEFELCLR